MNWLGMKTDGRAAPSEEATAAFLQSVIRAPCAKHDAPSGEPCWPSPTRGVCGERIGKARSGDQTKSRRIRTRS